MLETLAIILLILWVLGMVSSTAVGGFIHILLVVAVVLVFGQRFGKHLARLGTDMK